MIFKFKNNKKHCLCEETHMIEDFNPQGKTFMFGFNEDTCEKIRTGTCRVMELSKYKNNLNEFQKYSENNKCTKLAYSILKNGFICRHYEEVLIYQYRCGHYRFNNGRHRTCLAAKLGITIRAEIKNLEGDCDACNYDNKMLLETL